LTAGHCVTNQATGVVVDPSAITVVTGRRDLADTTGGTIHAVLRAQVNPGYDVTTRRNDAALLALASATAAPAAQLAAPGDRSLTGAGTAATVAGWGSLDGAGAVVPTVLHEATTTLVDDASCAGRLAGVEATSMLCAADTRMVASACHGDSGGPLAVRRGDGTSVQVGITSWGTANCDPGTPQVFTRVSAISGWVDGLLPSTTPPAVLAR
jgi:secreted trypsin-like serine protease